MKCISVQPNIAMIGQNDQSKRIPTYAALRVRISDSAVKIPLWSFYYGTLGQSGTTSFKRNLENITALHTYVRGSGSQEVKGYNSFLCGDSMHRAIAITYIHSQASTHHAFTVPHTKINKCSQFSVTIEVITNRLDNVIQHSFQLMNLHIHKSDSWNYGTAKKGRNFMCRK